MSNLEQQIEEFEVLLSIFPEEFAQISNLDELPKEWLAMDIKHFFRISLSPNDLGDSQEAHGGIVMIIKFAFFHSCTAQCRSIYWEQCPRNILIMNLY